MAAQVKTKLLILVSLIALTACDSGPNSKSSDENNENNNAAAKTFKGNTNKSYRFTPAAEGCDTLKRSFTTNYDMCLAIQVDSLNNNCAATDRHSHFNQYCPNFTWDPVLAQAQIKDANGKYVECTLTEDSNVEISQFSSNSMMMLELTKSRAYVQHFLANGRVTLNMTLEDAVTGRTTNRISKVWNDEAPQTTILSAPNSAGNPSLECLVVYSADSDND